MIRIKESLLVDKDELPGSDGLEVQEDLREGVKRRVPVGRLARGSDQAVHVFEDLFHGLFLLLGFVLVRGTIHVANSVVFTDAWKELPPLVFYLIPFSSGRFLCLLDKVVGNDDRQGIVLELVLSALIWRLEG